MSKSVSVSVSMSESERSQSVSDEHEKSDEMKHEKSQQDENELERKHEHEPDPDWRESESTSGNASDADAAALHASRQHGTRPRGADPARETASVTERERGMVTSVWSALRRCSTASAGVQTPLAARALMRVSNAVSSGDMVAE